MTSVTQCGQTGPVRSAPFPPWPSFDEDDVAVVSDVLRSGKVNYWTGDQGRLFECEFGDWLGCEPGVAVANGTAALEVCLRTLDIGPGDEVIVPSRTFIASASSAVMVGATPVIADIDAESQCLTAETAEAVLSPKTKAIVAVHLAGWPCEMEPILELAQRHGLKVIEDCAQAHGAQYKGRPVGTLGDMAAFSFCQDKIITTGGEGGMVTTRDAALREEAWSIKDHGKSYDAVYRRSHPPGFRWLHERFGTNWRMTEMQAVLGRLGLRKLDAWVQQRRQNAAALEERLAKIPAIRIVRPPAHMYHSYYRYYAFVRPDRLQPGWDRDRVMSAISAEGVPCFSGACGEIYLEKAFEGHKVPPTRLPVARELGETSLAFLVHPTIEERDLEDVCAATEKVFRACTV
jgi:dTDP-4-amino-4,6-dideoxygalactose transaminase